MPYCPPQLVARMHCPLRYITANISAVVSYTVARDHLWGFVGPILCTQCDNPALHNCAQSINAHIISHCWAQMLCLYVPHCSFPAIMKGIFNPSAPHLPLWCTHFQAKNIFSHKFQQVDNPWHQGNTWELTGPVWTDYVYTLRTSAFNYVNTVPVYSHAPILLHSWWLTAGLPCTQPHGHLRLAIFVSSLANCYLLDNPHIYFCPIIKGQEMGQAMYLFIKLHKDDHSMTSLNVVLLAMLNLL